MTPEAARQLNVAFVLAVSAILLSAFGVQFGMRELPCPLCLLQRLALLGVGTGAMLNVVQGVRPRHYGLSLASAIFGGIVAGRQVLLHVPPGDPGFGSPLLGWHLYTWSLVAFVCIAGLISAMLCLDGQFGGGMQPVRKAGKWSRAALGLFLLIAAANVVTTLLLCGLGSCEDDPTGYLWWT